MTDQARPSQSVIVRPGEGQSWWQPLPSRGHVDVHLTPENMPYDTFAAGTQTLPPGCMVREHGHCRNHELVFIHAGSGEVHIDGVTHQVEAGTTVLFARNSHHWIRNSGSIDMQMFWVFMPPGLEDWFAAIGRPRTPGDPMPDPFPRPDNVAEVMDRMRFLPPRDSN